MHALPTVLTKLLGTGIEVRDYDPTEGGCVLSFRVHMPRKEWETWLTNHLPRVPELHVYQNYFTVTEGRDPVLLFQWVMLTETEEETAQKLLRLVNTGGTEPIPVTMDLMAGAMGKLGGRDDTGQTKLSRMVSLKKASSGPGPRS